MFGKTTQVDRVVGCGPCWDEVSCSTGSITVVFQQCVKIVGILGEAAPMEKRGSVSCGKAGARKGGSAGPAWGGDLMWYQ